MRVLFNSKQTDSITGLSVSQVQLKNEDSGMVALVFWDTNDAGGVKYEVRGLDKGRANNLVTELTISGFLDLRNYDIVYCWNGEPV